jgi:amino acid transporter
LTHPTIPADFPQGHAAPRRAGATALTETSPLRRDISTTGGLLITLSCLSPSIGVFIVGSQVIHQVGSGAILCFIAPVILSVAISAVYAELGSAFPHSGGEYAMAGRALGPASGFAMLATNLAGFPLALATSGLGIADYLRVLSPNIPAIPTAVIATIAVTLIGVCSVRLNALVTGIFLAVEITALAVTAALGFAHAHSFTHTISLILHPQVAAPAGGLQHVPAIAMIVGASAGIYAFNGYGSAVALGEEIRGARRGISRVIFGAIFLAAIIEMLPMIGIIAGAPDLAALSRADSPVPDFLRATGGPTLALLLSLAAAAAIFNAMIAVVILGARQIYGAARDRGWPAPISRRLDRVHPRFGSPWVATLTLGAIGLGCCFIPLTVQIIIIANGNVAIYATLCLATIAGRRNGSTAHSHAKMKAFPLPPLLALAALGVVVWADLLDPDIGRPGLVAAVLILAAGALYYAIALRRDAAYALRGPVEE